MDFDNKDAKEDGKDYVDNDDDDVDDDDDDDDDGDDDDDDKDGTRQDQVRLKSVTGVIGKTKGKCTTPYLVLLSNCHIGR